MHCLQEWANTQLQFPVVITHTLPKIIPVFKDKKKQLWNCPSVSLNSCYIVLFTKRCICLLKKTARVFFPHKPTVGLTFVPGQRAWHDKMQNRSNSGQHFNPENLPKIFSVCQSRHLGLLQN